MSVTSNRNICEGFWKPKKKQRTGDGNRKIWHFKSRTVLVVWDLGSIKKVIQEEINKIPGARSPQESPKSILSSTPISLEELYPFKCCC